MLLCSREHVVVRCRFPLKIVRLNVIFAHWMIFEFIPHQDPPQIGMPIEVNAVKIKNLALLKLGAAPDRGERRQPRALCAVRSPHAHNQRSMFVRHGKEVINRFQISGNFILCGSIYFFLDSFCDRFHFHGFLYDSVEPIDSYNVRTKVEAQLCIVAKESRDTARVFASDQKRMLL